MMEQQKQLETLHVVQLQWERQPAIDCSLLVLRHPFLFLLFLGLAWARCPLYQSLWLQLRSFYLALVLDLQLHSHSAVPQSARLELLLGVAVSAHSHSLFLGRPQSHHEYP
jgi:hypothetical protein